MSARNTATPDLPGIFMANPAQTSRPLSPHLQIWRFTPSMAASITHRITGTINYGGLVLVGVWLATLAFAPDLYGAVAGFVRSPFGFILVAGFVWSLSFHLMNGLRHLYWDTGRGLAPATAKKTSIAIYIGSVLLAAIILWAGYAAQAGA